MLTSTANGYSSFLGPWSFPDSWKMPVANRKISVNPSTSPRRQPTVPSRHARIQQAMWSRRLAGKAFSESPARGEWRDYNAYQNPFET